METMSEFYKWERASLDVIDFKKIYVDMAGDLLAGLVLSEIVYWHLPSKDGSSKLRIEKNGKMWIAVHRYEWWERTRMTPDQGDRALTILAKKGLIEKKVFKFNGDPTTHIRLVDEVFLPALNENILEPKQNPHSPEAKSLSPTAENQMPKSPNSLTETTTKTTAKNTVVVVEDEPEPKTDEEPLPQPPNIYTIYEQELGPLSPMLADKLDDIDKTYPPGWFVEAVKEAKLSTTRVSLKYVESILKRWHAGGKAELPQKPKQRSSQPVTIILPDGTYSEALQ